MSSSRINPEKPFNPLKDILLATKNFGPEARAGDDGFGILYHGQLSESWQNRKALFIRFHDKVKQESRKKVEIMSNFNHENIISLIGYCDEANETIAVFECTSNGSLHYHLDSDDKRGELSWGQRLKICLGIARGLEYLHTGLADHSRVIRGDMMSSADILLDDNKEAKILDFGLSSYVDVNQDAPGTNNNLDPIYKETGVLNTESDAYSFGILLFEMLTGILASTEMVIDAHPHRLIHFVRKCAHEDRMDQLRVDAAILDETNIHSVRPLKEIALQCISWNLKDRPTMKTIISRIQEAIDKESHKQEDVSEKDIRRKYLPENLESLVIPKEEIISATENFSPETCIGRGALATVYKGRWHNRIVAIKRQNLDSHLTDEFINEVLMMSRFHHQNIIALVGFCEDFNDKIMVCDYADHGSLDRHLQDPDKGCFLAWTKRLKICLEVARGLEYLGEDVAVIHRGIKSENILLDHNLEAKICGFGLSVLVARDQPQVYHFLTGTSNYMDPIQ